MALPVKGLEAALLRFLANRGIEAEEITGIWDYAQEQGGCPTCYGGLDYFTEISYQPKGEQSWRSSRTYTFQGRFHELIQELTDV